MAAGTATEIEDDVQIYDTIAEQYKPAARHRLIEYDATVLARDFTKVPTLAKRKRKSVQPGFLVVQSKSEHTFYFVQVDNPDEDRLLSANLKKTIAEIPGPPRKARLPIKIRRVQSCRAGARPRRSMRSKTGAWPSLSAPQSASPSGSGRFSKPWTAS